MLKELTIRNFALIDEITVELTQGLNVLTGETGAGKSIVLDAIGILCGKRASLGFIRKGEERAKVEGYFTLTDELKDKINELDLIECDNELFLSREIAVNGNNKCKINYKTVPQSIYQIIGKLLFDIHGQNQEQSLLLPEKQMILLDGFLEEEDKHLLKEVKDSYGQFEAAKKKIDKILNDTVERKEMVDYYMFAIDEINKAELEDEEEDRLRDEKNRIVNGEKLSKKGEQIYSRLWGAQGCVASFEEVTFLLKEMSLLDDTITPIKDKSEEIFYGLQDVANDFRAYYDFLEYDESTLNRIERRLEIINALKRKYGNTVEAILSRKEEMALYVAQVENKDAFLKEYENQRDEALIAYDKFAGVLSEKRRESALKIEALIKENLENLGIYGDSFKVHFIPVEIPSEIGKERIEFYFSPNKGEGAQPLKKIASGGEVSRIMLAFKKVFVSIDNIPSMVFDEIDTGVGGESLLKVALNLHDISRARQVICVTHGPLIAAFADTHFRIKKEVVSERTKIMVIPLANKDARSEEIGRMLGGTEHLNLAKDQGEEMISFAMKQKNV